MTAEFGDRRQIPVAINALADAGFERSSVQLFSSKPVELPAGSLDRPSRISLYAAVGAILSGAAATTFVYWTQQDYPLITGGMPINSGWATGVITFETTMAGAIAGTLFGLIVEGGFLRFWRWRPARPPADGTVLVRVPDGGRTEEAARILRESGGVLVEEEA